MVEEEAVAEEGWAPELGVAGEVRVVVPLLVGVPGTLWGEGAGAVQWREGGNGPPVNGHVASLETQRSKAAKRGGGTLLVCHFTFFHPPPRPGGSGEVLGPRRVPSNFFPLGEDCEDERSVFVVAAKKTCAHYGRESFS